MYNAEGFLKLQQELSFSILNYFKPTFDHNSSINVWMQRFDYPKWTEDILLQALESFVGLIIMLSFVYTCISTVKVITAEKEKQLKVCIVLKGFSLYICLPSDISVRDTLFSEKLLIATTKPKPI